MANEITHKNEGSPRRLVQVVSPERLREVLDAAGDSYDRPGWFGPDDEWDVGLESDDLCVRLQIDEQGNGFPEIGELVTDGETVYQVTSCGRIQTAQYHANYMVVDAEIQGTLDCHDDDDGELYPVRVRVV